MEEGTPQTARVSHANVQLMALKQQAIVGTAIVDKIYVLKRGPSAHLATKMNILPKVKLFVVEGSVNVVLLGQNALQKVKSTDETRLTLS